MLPPLLTSTAVLGWPELAIKGVSPSRLTGAAQTVVMLNTYRGPATVVMNGIEVSVEARFRYTLDPSTVENFSYDRMKTWSGSLRTELDVDLFDAAPGVLRMPDGSEGEFMATSGGPAEVGISGLGPAPQMLVSEGTA